MFPSWQRASCDSSFFSPWLLQLTGPSSPRQPVVNGSFQLGGRHPSATAGKFNSLKVNKKESKETLLTPGASRPAVRNQRAITQQPETIRKMSIVQLLTSHQSKPRRLMPEIRLLNVVARGLIRKKNPPSVSLMLQTRGLGLDMKPEQPQKKI